MKQLKTPVVVERRRRKRILTLRNVRNAVLVLLVVVAGMNIRSEMRDTTGDDFGRLYERELAKAPVVEPAPVAEADVLPVDEAASADPFSLEAAAREQYLRAAIGAPVSSPAPSSAVVTFAGENTGAPKLKIVGGPDGVSVVEERRRAPVLGGGFGRE